MVGCVEKASQEQLEVAGVGERALESRVLEHYYLALAG